MTGALGGMAGTRRAFAYQAKDLSFLSHTPAGTFRLRGLRNGLAKADTANQNIQSVTIQTPWAADANELKVGLDIRLRGRLATSVTPNDAQGVFINGTLRLDREGNAYIDNTPAFDGELSPGTKMQVGTIGGLIAVQITFRSGAFAREAMAVVGAVSYSQGNDNDVDCTVTIDVGTPPALTGATAVFGASGFTAFTTANLTSTVGATNFESRGRNLYLQGAVLNTAGWANSASLFTLPAPFTPRTGIRAAISTTIITTGVEAVAMLSITAGGIVTLKCGATSMGGIFFNSLPAIPLSAW